MASGSGAVPGFSGHHTAPHGLELSEAKFGPALLHPMAVHGVDALALQEAQLPPSPESSDSAEEEALGADAEVELGAPRGAPWRRGSWWR
jgi:hypothetical protein